MPTIEPTATIPTRRSRWRSLPHDGTPVRFRPEEDWPAPPAGWDDLADWDSLWVTRLQRSAWMYAHRYGHVARTRRISRPDGRLELLVAIDGDPEPD